MRYVISDLSSQFVVAVDPTPSIKFLLREDPTHAKEFEIRAEALQVLEKANEYLRGHYRSLELAVRPAAGKRRYAKTLPHETERTPFDPSDRVNDQFSLMERYSRDMA